MNLPVRKYLCADALISAIYHKFKQIPDPRTLARTDIPFVDVLMSGLAVFGLKFPSLLSYDEQRTRYAGNLKTLYHVDRAPSDTYLRERLDEVDPKFLRPAFKKVFAELQRGKCLEEFEFWEGYYLLSIDGTGEFSSSSISCPYCCKKEYKDGSVAYYHQMLGACIVHPEKANVIPFCPETIQNSDGSEKVEISEETEYHEILDEKGFLHQFRYLNDVPLNKSNSDVRVNFLEYMQTDPKGKEMRFSWVTNIWLTQKNVFTIMKGGRARWKIKNETFNTLKNLGYNFEHNYGHGKRYLSTILCLLMMLAFLIDQTQGIACSLFRAVKERLGTNRFLWKTIRSLFQWIQITSWEWFYKFMMRETPLDTS